MNWENIQIFINVARILGLWIRAYRLNGSRSKLSS